MQRRGTLKKDGNFVSEIEQIRGYTYQERGPQREWLESVVNTCSSDPEKALKGNAAGQRQPTNQKPNENTELVIEERS